MLNTILVAADKARRYLASMAGTRRNQAGGTDMSLMTGFVDVRPDAVPVARPRSSKTTKPSGEQRLVEAVGRANRREGVRSLKGLTDQEILDRITG